MWRPQILITLKTVYIQHLLFLSLVLLTAFTLQLNQERLQFPVHIHLNAVVTPKMLATLSLTKFLTVSDTFIIIHPQSISSLVFFIYACLFFLVWCAEVRDEIWACTRNDRSTETYTHSRIQRTHHTQRADIWVTSFLSQVVLNTIPASSSRVVSGYFSA